ncbi:unnamed protein product [Orchesella dallaii]|uniref:Chitin-binding type-2 domain-containing protein n=1 Tax=Orchesella dallaii TaxID=48710 RepID=A0ABP1QFL1_9HEXA
MKRRSPGEMGKMINVRVGEKLEEKEGKKCYLAARNARKKNMTCSATTTTPTPAPSSTSPIINKPSNMDFFSLSPPHLHHFETYTHCISFTKKRRTSGWYPSSSSYPFSIRTLVSTAPILISLLLYIAIRPVSGMGNDSLPTTPLSPNVSSSTLKTLTSSHELHGESLQEPEASENHRHHPHSSHLVELPSSDEPAANGQQQADGHHKCYVCLPPDKTSRDAEEILTIFPEETRQRIPDCASFGSHNAKHFEFKCPPEYVGCLLRIHGRNESRSCFKHPLNDCKTANSVEFCYCTGALCNDNRPEILLEETESDERQRAQLEDEKEERETRKIWQKGETDDEDLLGPHHVDIDGMQDDGDYGSGSEPPPGVIHQYTSTPKPILRPNIRPDTRTTTPKSTSGAPGSTIVMLSAFTIPCTYITIPTTALLSSLVPLILPFIIAWNLSSLQPLVKNQ